MAFGIFKRDIAALARNPFALILVLGLMALPGLYAWYSIVANWDPYSHTSSVPIAVVNQDAGVTDDLVGTLNVGAQVTEKLADNEDIEWHIYDSLDEALEDTEYSLCYATIVFPKDFSENLVGVVKGSSEQPQILYYPNEKTSAVATKVTDAAVGKITTQVNQQFSSSVNEKILGVAESLSQQGEDRAIEAHASVLAKISSVRSSLGDAELMMDDVNISIAGWRETAANLRGVLSTSHGQIATIRAALDAGQADVELLNTQVTELEGSFSSALLGTTGMVSTASARAAGDVAGSAANISEIRGNLGVVIGTLESLAEVVPSDDLREEILVTLSDLRNLNDRLATLSSDASDSITRLSIRSAAFNANVQNTVGTFSTQVLPQLNAGSRDLSVALGGLSASLAQIDPYLYELEDVLARTDDALARASSAVDSARTMFVSIDDHLGVIATDLSALGNALQIDELAELLDVEPEKLGEFLSSPVKMSEQVLYPVSNYGTAVAPFYTNLALWVGCFIIASILRTEVKRKGFEKATAMQRYFGRWLLFMTLALLQSQVICGVDILLGIDCANPALFMLSGAICSFAYMNLIFALVISFRNLGKTLCILVLILQVPGSSGVYPIEMVPSFFQAIHGMLPFTYGIDAMREALVGLYGLQIVSDWLLLLSLVPLSLLLVLIVRRYFMGVAQLFDTELSRTGFFAGEQDIHVSSKKRLRSAIRLLLGADDQFEDIEERAIAFSRVYPRIRRVGSIILFAMPFAVLALLAPFNTFDTSIEDKLAQFLVLIVVMLVVSAVLVVLDYANHAIREEASLLGASLVNEHAEASEGAEVVKGAEEDASGGDAAPMISAADTVMKGHARHRGVVRDIFRTDVRLGFQSVIGVVVVVLLVVTPSIYAWFNIAASWDPYGATERLKVAVANGDEGYTSDLVSIPVNAGDALEAQLRQEGSFDWEFVSEEEAITGVESGEYYAAVVIPSSFSRSMMTYLFDEASYPEVAYYTNAKKNPIAPLIMQRGSSSLQENIRTTFVETTDQVALTIAHSVLLYFTSDSLVDYSARVSTHFDNLVDDMQLTADELHILSDLCESASSIAASAQSSIEGAGSAIASAKDSADTAKRGLERSASAFDSAFDSVEALASDGSSVLDELQANADSALEALQSGAADAPEKLEKLKEKIDTWSEVISSFADDLDPETSAAAIAQLRSLVKALDGLSSSVDAAIEHAGVYDDHIGQTRAELDGAIGEIRSGMVDVRRLFSEGVGPTLERVKTSASTISSSVDEMAGNFEGVASGLSQGGSTLPEGLSSFSKALMHAGDEAGEAATNLRDAKAKVVGALSSDNAKKGVSILLDVQPHELATRLATPVSYREEPIYSVANFGSSMAPFYTVLSLWVGALVMVTTMNARLVSERVEELRRRFGRVRPRHEYFGRFGIFSFVAFLQSALVLLGDLLLFRIQCVEPVAFFVFGIFIGQVFCLFVYTLTELFGNIGKALCVILLIMQVAASGGTFPIEMLDPMLINLVPFMPFYHGMTMLQECVAGIEWTSIVFSVGFFVIAAGILLLVGVVVRKPFRKSSELFQAQLEKTGLI